MMAEIGRVSGLVIALDEQLDELLQPGVAESMTKAQLIDRLHRIRRYVTGLAAEAADLCLLADAIEEE